MTNPYSKLTNDKDVLFCGLYTNYKNRLVYFAVRFLKSETLAEDVVQEAFISLWHNKEKLDEEQSIESYLFTVVKNKVFTLLKNIKKEQALKEILIKEAIDYNANSMVTDSLIEQDFEKILQQLLDSLTPQQKRVFEMSRQLKLSHKEIANELGISLYTVQQHISDALRTIRSQLSNITDLHFRYIFLLLFFST